MGESPCLKTYGDDFIELAEAYKEQQSRGKHFVHVRTKRSGSRGLRALKGATSGKEVYSVDLGNH